MLTGYRCRQRASRACEVSSTWIVASLGCLGTEGLALSHDEQSNADHCANIGRPVTHVRLVIFCTVRGVAITNTGGLGTMRRRQLGSTLHELRRLFHRVQDPNTKAKEVAIDKGQRLG